MVVASGTATRRPAATKTTQMLGTSTVPNELTFASSSPASKYAAGYTFKEPSKASGVQSPRGGRNRPQGGERGQHALSTCGDVSAESALLVAAGYVGADRDPECP
jgi:hypothetical protein